MTGMTAKPKNLRYSNDNSVPEKSHNHIAFSVLVCLEPNIGLTFQFNTYIQGCYESRNPHNYLLFTRISFKCINQPKGATAFHSPDNFG